MPVVEVLRFVNLVFGAVLFGSMILEHRILIPVIRSRPPREGVELLRAISPIALGYVPQCAQVSFLAGFGTLVWWRDLGFQDTAWTLAGFLLSAAAVAITFGWYFPIEYALRGLRDEVIATEAPPMMRRLAAVHRVRVVFYGVGYVCFVVAAL